MDNEIGEAFEIVALVRDLMFASRVRAAAPAARVVQDAGMAVESIGTSTRLVLVELEAAGASGVVEAAIGRGVSRVVAFAPHVRTELMERAREAGAEVLPRGAFVKRLGALVRGAGES